MSNVNGTYSKVTITVKKEIEGKQVPEFDVRSFGEDEKETVRLHRDKDDTFLRVEIRRLSEDNEGIVGGQKVTTTYFIDPWNIHEIVAESPAF